MPSLVTDLTAESITHLFINDLTSVDLIVKAHNKVILSLWQSNICINIHLDVEDLPTLVDTLTKEGVSA